MVIIHSEDHQRKYPSSRGNHVWCGVIRCHLSSALYHESLCKRKEQARQRIIIPHLRAETLLIWIIGLSHIDDALTRRTSVIIYSSDTYWHWLHRRRSRNGWTNMVNSIKLILLFSFSWYVLMEELRHNVHTFSYIMCATRATITPDCLFWFSKCTILRIKAIRRVDSVSLLFHFNATNKRQAIGAVHYQYLVAYCSLRSADPNAPAFHCKGTDKEMQFMSHISSTYLLFDIEDTASVQIKENHNRANLTIQFLLLWLLLNISLKIPSKTIEKRHVVSQLLMPCTRTTSHSLCHTICRNHHRSSSNNALMSKRLWHLQKIRTPPNNS